MDIILELLRDGNLLAAIVFMGFTLLYRKTNKDYQKCISKLTERVTALEIQKENLTKLIEAIIEIKIKKGE
jgi:hypothetical protein